MKTQGFFSRLFLRHQRKSIGGSDLTDTDLEPALNYNQMYSLFNPNNEPDNIIGKIAYCLYKESKQKFITEFNKKNNRDPSELEIDTHVQCSEMPKVAFYKNQARDIFLQLQVVITKNKEERMEEKFKEDLWDFVNTYEPLGFFERQSTRVKALLFGGIGGVIGNFLTTLIIVLILFFSASTLTQENMSKNAKINILSGFAQILGIQIDIKSQ